MEHIAYNNHRNNYNQWQVLFYEANLLESRLPYIPSHMDNVINHLLAGYHDFPFYNIPRSRVYETQSPHTYDTLQRTYMHRQYAMTPQSLHHDLPSFSEHRANMLSRQWPLPPLPLQGWPIDQNYLRFQIDPQMSSLALSKFQRETGPIYNLLTLYATHNGPLPRLQSNRSVRAAIVNELQRDNVRHNYRGLIDIESDDPFGPQEFRCLLQALLGGTLLPSQYSGRMLPYGLISFLRSHVDTAA